ncbi:CHAT domain-containing protein [Armillaria borealis]|uniref:CHAT domain-containing protein n=1 Tax=Armillaria borealis TaxID=47425 RepID=A0AA39MMS7_9AGAR|nr:CHAT domain-containing protein [Armillaria borealis]
MSDSKDADAGPATEQTTYTINSTIRLTGFTIKLRADLHPNIRRDNAIFVKCTIDGIVMQESTMIKEAESTWRLVEIIQTSTEIPSFTLSILNRRSGHDDNILAHIELETATLISEFATRNRRWSQVFGNLDNDDPVVELAFRVVIVPSSNPPSANGDSLPILPTTNGQSGPHAPLNDLNPALLHDRGAQFMVLSEQYGHEQFLQHAISALVRSASLTSDRDPDKPPLLSDLCLAFLRRFELLSDCNDLERAIKSGQDAVALAVDDRPDQPSFFINLSNSYLRRFEFLGDQDNLDSAVSAAELAVHFSAEGNPRKRKSLYTLACCLNRRFQRLGKVDDIKLAIEAGRLASSLAAEGEQLKPMALDIVAFSFYQRFKRLGQSDDLEQSISEEKNAVASMPEGFPQRFRMLNSLNICLRERFELFDDPADLDEAILKGTHAVNAVPSRCPDKPGILSNVGVCFFKRFTLRGELKDLNEAISLMQSAVSDAPDGHVFRPTMLNNLGIYFRHRFSKTDDANDLDEAVSAGQRAVACLPDGHSEKPSRLNSLVASLRERFKARGGFDDLEESISCGKKAIALIPDGHPEKPEILLHLGVSVASRFDRRLPLNPQSLPDAVEAISLFKSAALSSTGPPSARLDAAIQWAELCRDIDFPSALEAYQFVVELLPRVAWTGKSIDARHRELAHFGHIVKEAAAYALELGEADTALEWLEMGRAIVWGQLHNLRSPVDSLSDAHPKLAEELSQVAVALEKASSRGVNTEHFKELSLEDIAKEHRRLATRWDSLVERVRALPGFEDFLQPKKLTTLKNAAKLGPVVLVNAYRVRCDALILIPGLDEVVHIPLKNFSYRKAEILHKQLNKSLSDFGVRTRASRPAYGSSNKDVFVTVLKELWSCIVKPVLDSLAFFPSDDINPPRLWWCATGPLAFLPIHAAGQYGTNEPGAKLSDYVVSSYTPTLTALLDKLQKTRTFKGLLAISQPNTPGLSNLPGTKGELQKIEERANELHVEYLRGDEATPDTVLNGMSTCNWVHMACHATQEKAKPLDSTFRLHHSLDHPDGHLPLSLVIAKSFPDADFAYLSACQTATGDESLSEESVHLAAGMLMAGYQSVLATLWSIRDADAPLVADAVYFRLFEDREPDSGKAAVALHHAVQSLRKCVEKEPDSFVRWVPFIHVGV